MSCQIVLWFHHHVTLLRGAVAKGDYYHKKAIAFGRVMVDAYQYMK